MPFIERHINFVFDTKGEASILQKLANPINFKQIRDIINNVDPFLLERCVDFSVCTSKEIAPFYWVYKKNYDPWIEIDSFVSYMSEFKLLFQEGSGGLCCNNVDEMMFSLAIVFYFDKQIHS